jgi:putative FmdB family regulatory protein
MSGKRSRVVAIMPIYEYQCHHCRVIFEVIQNLRSRAYRKCPRCNRRAKRILSTPSLNLRNYSSPTEAKYARMPIQEELAREKALQKSYETIRLPKGVKHNPWHD